MYVNKSAFTIMELLIVVVLLAILAGFGIPNYTKARNRANEREGIHNLRVIASAMDAFSVRNNGFPPANLAQVGNINNSLKLGIIEQNMDYSCVSNTATYTCTAAHADGWSLSVSSTNDGDPVCAAGACPSCTGAGCP